MARTWTNQFVCSVTHRAKCTKCVMCTPMRKMDVPARPSY